MLIATEDEGQGQKSLWVKDPFSSHANNAHVVVDPERHRQEGRRIKGMSVERQTMFRSGGVGPRSSSVGSARRSGMSANSG